MNLQQWLPVRRSLEKPYRLVRARDGKVVCDVSISYKSNREADLLADAIVRALNSHLKKKRAK